jgi:LPS export ABC transporter protein LptC
MILSSRALPLSSRALNLSSRALHLSSRALHLSSRAQRGICSALLAAIVLASCGKGTKPPVVSEPGIADSADQVIFDGRSLLTESGVKRGQMFADTILVFNDQTHFVLRRVRATFNTETGALNGTLRGDRGTYDKRSGILEGFGNVVVTSTDGKRLASPHLKYVQRLDAISSDSAFTLTEPGRTQRGIGFTSDPNLKSFRCFRACSGSALVPIGDLTKP